MYTESLAKLSLSYWKESRALSTRSPSPPLPGPGAVKRAQARCSISGVNCLLSNVAYSTFLGWNCHYEKATGPDKCLFITELHTLLIKDVLVGHSSSHT